MEELVLSKHDKRKLKPRSNAEIAAMWEAKREKSLEELYRIWHKEQLDAVKDALTSAFDDRYEIVEHSVALHSSFLALDKGTTKENQVILNRLLDIHETGGPIGAIRGTKAYTITIHFPKLVVTDGHKKHTIFDLWTKVELSAGFNSSNYRGGGSYFKGNRSTFSYAEICSNYAFSHLENGWKPAWRNFCLGHTPFAFLCTDLTNSWDKHKFLAFCFQLEDYLSWESRDGGPYKNLCNIQETSSGSSARRVSSAELQAYYSRLLMLKDKIPTDFMKTPYLWILKVRKDEEFERLCTQCTDRIDLVRYDPVSKTKYPRIINDKTENIARLKREYKSSILRFKDKPVHLEITDTVDQQNDDELAIASNEVVQGLEYLLNSAFINEIRNEYRK